MTTAFYSVAALLLAAFLVLFLGGLCSAALEIRREKRAGVPVTRPGWQRRKDRPGYTPPADHSIPLRLAVVLWPLTALGMRDWAARYSDWWVAR